MIQIELKIKDHKEFIINFFSNTHITTIDAYYTLVIGQISYIVYHEPKL